MGPLDLAIAEEQDVTLSFSLEEETEQDHINHLCIMFIFSKVIRTTKVLEYFNLFKFFIPESVRIVEMTDCNINL